MTTFDDPETRHTVCPVCLKPMCVCHLPDSQAAIQKFTILPKETQPLEKEDTQPCFTDYPPFY